MEVSPKRIAKQWEATYGGGSRPARFLPQAERIHGQSVPNPSRSIDVGLGGFGGLDSTSSDVSAMLREETYKKSKKTGTEKLRCKLDGLDAELVDDLVGLPGPVPCTLEFRTPCDDDEWD